MSKIIRLQYSKSGILVKYQVFQCIGQCYELRRDTKTMQTLVRRVSQLHAALTCMLGNRPHRFMIKAVLAPAIAGGFLTELVVTSVSKKPISN